MKAKAFATVPLVAAMTLVACSSSSSNGSDGATGSDGGAVGNSESGGACLETESGNVVNCIAWSNISTSEASELCPAMSAPSVTIAHVSSCPNANAVGTCHYNVDIGAGMSLSYSTTLYSTGDFTCASAKSTCVGGGSSLTGTFTGNGC